MSVSTQRSTKGVLRNLHKLTDALLEENSRLQVALTEANAQIAALHAGLELLRRDVAARDRYDGEVRDHVAAIIDGIQSHYKPLLEQHQSQSPDVVLLSPVRSALDDIHAEDQHTPSATDAQHRPPLSSINDNFEASDVPVPEQDQSGAEQGIEQIAGHVEQEEHLTTGDSDPGQEANTVTQEAIQTRDATVFAPQDAQQAPVLGQQPSQAQQAEQNAPESEENVQALYENNLPTRSPDKPQPVLSPHTGHEHEHEHEHDAMHEEEEVSNDEHSVERSPGIEHEAQFSQTHPEPRPDPELHSKPQQEPSQEPSQELHTESQEVDTPDELHEDFHEDFHPDEQQDLSQREADPEITRSTSAVGIPRDVGEAAHYDEPQLDDDALDVSHLRVGLTGVPSDLLQENSDVDEQPLAALLGPASTSKETEAEAQGSEHEQKQGNSEYIERGDRDDTEEQIELPPGAIGETTQHAISSKGVSDDSGYHDLSGDTSGHEAQDVDEHIAQVVQEVRQHEEGSSTQVVNLNPYHSPTELPSSSSQGRLRTLFSLPFAADVERKPEDSAHEIAKKLYEAGGKDFESCSSVFRVIRKKRRSTAESEDDDVQDDHSIEFVTLRPQTAEVLPWKAREGSDYIDVTNGALAVKPLAAVTSRFGTASLNASLRVLEPLRMPAGRKDFCYISPVYPDGTSLPYVPVNNVILQHQPRGWAEGEYGVNKVRLSFQKHVFEEVKEIAIKAYQNQYPGSNVVCDGMVTPKRVRKVVAMDADAKVDVSVFFRRPMRLGIFEALSLIELDLVGLVLLYIGVDAKNNDGSEAELAFRIHSMVMKRVVTKKTPPK